MNSGHLLDYTILQQLDRPNRYVLLEVWDTADNYAAWSAGKVTTDFLSKLTPLLGSPLDQRGERAVRQNPRRQQGLYPALR